MVAPLLLKLARLAVLAVVVKLAVLAVQGHLVKDTLVVQVTQLQQAHTPEVLEVAQVQRLLRQIPSTGMAA
jgi:hypothetical protein